MRVLLLAGLILLLAASGARAQTPPAPDPCPGAATQADLNDCAGRAWRTADAELNRVYGVLMDRVEGAAERRIRKAQRAWLAFRDAHCEVEASAYAGGSIQPMIHAFCLAETTRHRTAQLRDHLDDLDR